MEMDEDMEIDPMVFDVREIDLEYEFDAARWFDFSRVESPAESQLAEFWFRSAPSYAPSPFVTKLLLREDVTDDLAEASTRFGDGESEAEACEEDGDSYQHSNLATGLNKTGPMVSNHKNIDKPKFRAKSSIRPTPRSSTLMKPTVSQLAKHNNPSKIHMQVDQFQEKSLCGTSGSEVQAAKRQKLDGGLLCKVAQTKQEMNFVHKTPKKDTTLDTNLQHTRTKITIPHEPDFATSHRTHRIRHRDDAKSEQDSTSVYRFKARPFNRKIFDAPSLPIRKKSTPKLPEFHEFRLKTSERALQHSSAVTTRSHIGTDKCNITDELDGVNRESRRATAMETPNHTVSEGKQAFKAHPLNKKILSSRGDMGIFKNSKREPTLPVEFSFHSEKKAQPDLPTELFSKLSIKSELYQHSGSHTRFPQPKVSKENRVNPFQAASEVTKMAAGKPVSSTRQQTQQFGNSGITPETSQRRMATRSLGIR
ncbi:unnamed protein product [Cochlearia groenlandica]